MTGMRDGGSGGRRSGLALVVLLALAAMVGTYLSFLSFLAVDFGTRGVALMASTGVLWALCGVAIVMALRRRDA